MKHQKDDNQIWQNILTESTADLSEEEFQRKFTKEIEHFYRVFDVSNATVDSPWTEHYLVPALLDAFSKWDNPDFRDASIARKFIVSYGMEGPNLYRQWEKEDERRHLDGFVEKINAEFTKFMDGWYEKYKDEIKSKLFGSDTPHLTDLGVPSMVEEEEKDPRGVYDRPAADDEPPSRNDINNEMIGKLLDLHDILSAPEVDWTIKQGDFSGVNWRYVTDKLGSGDYIPGTDAGDAKLNSFEGLANLISLATHDEEVADKLGLKNAVFNTDTYIHVFNAAANNNMAPVKTRFEVERMEPEQKKIFDAQQQKHREYHKVSGLSQRFIADFIKSDGGSEFLDKYQYHPAAQSGPYKLAIYPDSEEIKSRGDVVGKAVGYGKPGRYHGD